MRVVIDTNILVSGLLSPYGAPETIVDMVLNRRLTPCYDSRILAEYYQVLRRSKFHFPLETIEAVLSFIVQEGFSVVPNAVDIPFADQSDKCFYEVAVFCETILLTGNTKHFPKDPHVVSASDFLKDWQSN